MLKLLIFPPAFGQVSASPFCTKSMAQLKLNGVDFETKLANSQKAPMKKLPVLVDGAQLIPDSQRIVEYLAKTRGLDLDKSLTNSQRAKAHVIRRTLEEHTYWAVLYLRWLTEDGWSHMKPMVSKMVPSVAAPFMVPLIRRAARSAATGQGLARHPREDIERFGADDVRSVAALVEDGPFCFGHEPSNVDAVIYAFMGLIRGMKTPSQLSHALEAEPRLLEILDTVDQRMGA